MSAQPSPVSNREHATAISASLIAAYATAWSHLQAVQQQAVLSGSRRAIRAFIATVKNVTGQLDQMTYQWASEQFSQVYALGAEQGLAPLGEQFSWTPEHEATALTFASGTWASLRTANDNVRKSAGRVGKITKEVDRSTTPKELADMLAKHGAAAVVYKGGARHGLEDYATMAIRTQTTLAFNKGTIQAASAAGVNYFEISDGVGCGLAFHNDGSEADGMIVSEDVAGQYLISHPNCCIAGTLVVPVGLAEAGYRAHYAGPVCDLTTAQANVLTVTPNHPILTDRGWLPAIEVEHGDKVVSSSGLHAVAVGPDIYDGPAPIEKIFESIECSGTHARVVSAPSDFHGDAVHMQPEVDVVTADSHFGGIGNGALSEQQSESLLASAGLNAPELVSPGPLLNLGVGTLHATNSVVSGGDMRGIGVLVADSDSSRLESIAEGVVADRSAVAYLESTLACEVTFDEIVQNVSREFEGDVYDLSTSERVYFASGILVHNCIRQFSARPDIVTQEDADAAGVDEE